MSEAGVGAGDQVWSVNAHATSTPLGDQAEAGAIASVLHGSNVMVTSNKGLFTNYVIIFWRVLDHMHSQSYYHHFQSRKQL